MTHVKQRAALLWAALALLAGGCGGGGGRGGSPGAGMDVPPAPMAPVNAAPSIAAVPDQSADEDGIAGPIEITVDDAENHPSELEVTATTSDGTLLPPQGIDLAGAGATRELNLIPGTGQTGTTDVTVTVTDIEGASASSSFRLVVKPLFRAEFPAWMRDTVLARGEFDAPVGERADDGAVPADVENLLRIRFSDASAEDPAAYDDLLPQ